MSKATNASVPAETRRVDPTDVSSVPDDGPPAYVKCSPERWAEAKIKCERLQVDPHAAQMAGFRRSALVAQMSSGAYLDPALAIEFRSLVESRNYVPRAVVSVQPQPMADALGALSWPSDLPVPNAAPVSDHGDWLDTVMGLRRPR